MAAPCHTNCSSAQLSACAAGCRSSVSIAVVVTTVGLPLLSGGVDRLPDVEQLFGCGATGRERLHDELRGVSAKRPLEQVAHELPLRLLFAQPCAIDVRAVP